MTGCRPSTSLIAYIYKQFSLEFCHLTGTSEQMVSVGLCVDLGNETRFTIPVSIQRRRASDKFSCLLKRPKRCVFFCAFSINPLLSAATCHMVACGTKVQLNDISNFKQLNIIKTWLAHCNIIFPSLRNFLAPKVDLSKLKYNHQLHCN